MSHLKRQLATGKHKANIKLTQRASLVEKNNTIPTIRRVMPQDNGVNFKIKIRRKG